MAVLKLPWFLDDVSWKFGNFGGGINGLHFRTIRFHAPGGKLPEGPIEGDGQGDSQHGEGGGPLDAWLLLSDNAETIQGMNGYALAVRIDGKQTVYIADTFYELIEVLIKTAFPNGDDHIGGRCDFVYWCADRGYVLANDADYLGALFART